MDLSEGTSLAFFLLARSQMLLINTSRPVEFYTSGDGA